MTLFLGGFFAFDNPFTHWCFAGVCLSNSLGRAWTAAALLQQAGGPALKLTQWSDGSLLERVFDSQADLEALAFLLQGAVALNAMRDDGPRLGSHERAVAVANTLVMALVAPDSTVAGVVHGVLALGALSRSASAPLFVSPTAVALIAGERHVRVAVINALGAPVQDTLLHVVAGSDQAFVLNDEDR